MAFAGADDLERASNALLARVPAELGGFVELAFNFRWSWLADGAELFEAIDAHRWELCGGNPLRLLREAPQSSLDRAARDAALLERVAIATGCVRGDLARRGDGRFTPERPVAFLCAEFGVHASLPIYAGGLGVLAGDMLKAASDRGLAMVGVGLLYRQGAFHQGIDASGWQHEYWSEVDPERLPMALVTGADGRPITVSISVRRRPVVAQIWRVDVGRVPLFLLDTQCAENTRQDRAIASRLYPADRGIRLAQYLLLGVGGVRALRALGIDPAVIHLNEGHAALAPLELASIRRGQGAALADALASAARHTVFTTHTPVAAGNEGYGRDELDAVLGDYPASVGLSLDEMLALGRTHPGSHDEPVGMTQLGLRMSRSRNGVSRRHGEVARAMWQPLYGGQPAAAVPIRHVTNGVHVATWMAPPMQRLFDRYLGPGWVLRTADPATWKGVADIPDSELWQARCEMRAQLVAFVRDRSVDDRIARNEPHEYVEAAARAFDPDVLTIGFARRLATYKRLHLIAYDAARVVRFIQGARPIQLVIAGKAHPADDQAKRIVQDLFRAKQLPRVGDRVAFLHDYDLALARALVRGCDVWVNAPRPPLEASGTSGMKSVMNGGLQLSVLDGWWAEGYDGQNGWAIPGEVDDDHGAQDARHAAELHRLLEEEVIPSFHDRDEGGIPRGWVARMKASLRTLGPAFAASRMLDDYVRSIYAPDPDAR